MFELSPAVAAMSAGRSGRSDGGGLLESPQHAGFHTEQFGGLPDCVERVVTVVERVFKPLGPAGVFVRWAQRLVAAHSMPPFSVVAAPHL